MPPIRGRREADHPTTNGDERVPADLQRVPGLQLGGGVVAQTLAGDGRLSLRAQERDVVGTLAVVQHRVEEGDGGAVEDDVVIGVPPDVEHALVGVEGVKLDLPVGADDL